MAAQVPFVFVLLASMTLLSSAYNLNPPANYSWPKNSKNLCFAGRFDFVLNVDYLQASGVNSSVRIPLNNNTYESYSASCSPPANVHQLTLSMLGGFTNVILQFTVNEKNVTSLTKVDVYVIVNDKQTVFPNYANATAGTHKFSSNQSLFVTDRGNSYRCNTKSTIRDFQSDSTLTVTSIELENLRIQPFVDDTQAFNDYGVEKVCQADIEKDSNLIPIIVGVCLAVLVIIVLAAYLIGRRRSRNGYQSV